MPTLPSTQDVLGSNLDREGLEKYFLSSRPQNYLDRQERRLWIECGCKPGRVDSKMQMIEHAVDKARTKWACISAKSQREDNFKFKEGRQYVVKTYSQLTEIKHTWERPDTTAPPPNRTGEVIHKFSRRSRQRMMSKARKLNHSKMKMWNEQTGGRDQVDKELPIPWFVTLTYHKNFQDCEKAKEKHLNNFLERWRKRGKDFAYFWKMEPQKRGAVHFHLALFLPEKWTQKVDYIDFPLNLKKDDYSEKHKLLMKVISTDWAEVTKDVDGYSSRYSKITRFNKGRSLSAACLDEKKGRFIDWEHLKYGTNVRKCENWKMFLGYCYKYMTEKVDKFPFSPTELISDRTLEVSETTFPTAPFRYVHNIAPARTGRFWGFSYNLDFEALQSGIVDHRDLDEMNRFCNTLNTLTFCDLTNHLIKNAKRAKKKYSGKELQRKLEGYRRTFESQKRRFKINRDKIREGYFLQFEIKSERSLKLRKYLRENQDFNEMFRKHVDKFENIS